MTRWESVTASAHHVTADEADALVREGDVVLDVEVNTRAGERLGVNRIVRQDSTLRVFAYGLMLDEMVHRLTVAGDGIIL